MQNQTYLQHESFQEKVIPAIAKDRPIEGLTLIRQISESTARSFVLRDLVKRPSVEGQGRYRRKVPSAILDPEMVEAEFPAMHLDDEGLRRVKEAIQRRREYEAKQPEPPPATW